MATDDQYSRMTSVGRSVVALCELDPFFVSLKAIFHILKERVSSKKGNSAMDCLFFAKLMVR